MKVVRTYLELAKPRILVMVLVTTAIGFWLSGGSGAGALAWTLIATALASSASGALNQLFEIEQDAAMSRTRVRPLPSGRLAPGQALVFGLVCAVVSLFVFALKVNVLAGGLAAFAMACYLLVYTPMKTRSPQSTWAGAVAGAVPPLIGWAAGAGSLSARAYLLFGIQLLWQIPHFLCIFWIYREDYARAGFRTMPVVDPGGRATAIQIAVHSLGLLLATLLPSLSGMAGPWYGLGALIVGSSFLYLGLRASWTMAIPDARRLFFASLLYLPVVFGMLLASGI